MDSAIVNVLPRAARDEKREAILRTAYEAFLTEGYAATSMSSIAARVGGSKATLYNYFSSKEELFAAVIDEKCQDLQALLFATSEDASDFRAMLSGLGERFLKLLLCDDKIATYRLITAETARFPELGRSFYQSGPALGRENLSRLFAQAVADGHLKPGDTRVMATLFFDMCGGDIHRRRLWNVTAHVTDAEIRAHVANVVSVFLAAYGV